jgi:membrane dipeptidase
MMKESEFQFSVIDAHCDSLMGALEGINLAKPVLDGHLDLPRLLEGGVTCQFMALFVADENLGEARSRTHRMIDAFYSLCDASQGRLFPVLAGKDLHRARQGSVAGGLLSIEGAEALEGSLDAVDEFYARGVRALGVTWNRRNPFARGWRAEGSDGLSPLGFALVEKMEALGMIVDVSHLSDQGFEDLAGAAQRPFVASHSNAREICPAPRNLTDRQIRGIADSGGVIGTVFVPAFVTSSPENPPKALYELLLDHIDHIVKVGGINSVGFGSDFDGFKEIPDHKVIASPAEFPRFAQGLERRGYRTEEIEKIMGGNWTRLIVEILG